MCYRKNCTYKKLPPINLRIDGHQMQPSQNVRNLGVVFDRHASMETQVKSVCRSAYVQLRRLRRIKKYLPRDSLETLVHAFVSSRLDYCNALYLGIPQKQLSRLQLVQNCAARLLAGANRRDHVTPLLESLHWLPIEQRIRFKILLLVFKAVNDIGPKYLCDLFSNYVPSRSLRSENQTLLVVPFTRSSLVRNCAFSFAGAKHFNNLLCFIKERFKGLFLFRECEQRFDHIFNKKDAL